MGKERDKLLWSLGKKPSSEADEEFIARQAMKERIARGDIPQDYLDILNDIKDDEKK